MSRRKKTIKGERILALLEECGMTQKDLAEEVEGYERPAINKAIKSGEAVPELILAIAKAFQVSPRYLTGEIDDRFEVVKFPAGSEYGYMFINQIDPDPLDMSAEEREAWEAEKIAEAEKADALPDMAAFMYKRKIEKKKAREALKKFLETDYMLPSWKHIENDERLNELVEGIRQHLETL